MRTKTTLHIKLFIFATLIIDVSVAILSFMYDYNVLAIFIYSIVSALFYLVLFSMNLEASTIDIKSYSIISWISIFLFTYITFGPYLGNTGYTALPSILFVFATYGYYSLRTKYDEFYQVILINFIYLSIKFGLIFMMIYFVGLAGLGSV